MTFTTSALDLVAWLRRAAKPGYEVVRERYGVTAATWNVGRGGIRPDCNMETILAYTLAYRATGDAGHLARARTIYSEIRPLQGTSGSWPFMDIGGDYDAYTNDNAEVAIFLLRAAELDPAMASTYRATALATTDYLQTHRNMSGFWPGSLPTYRGDSPFATYHAVAALAAALPFASDGAAYLNAMTIGLDATHSVLGADGHVPITEPWRPPSSDACIGVRALAMAEAAAPNHPKAGQWRADRLAILGWLDGLFDPTTGAVRNGYGVPLNQGDVWRITDHVYVTAFAIEAYLRSHAVDGVGEDRARHIAQFAADNIWYDAGNLDANGCLRGAYDLTSADFHTEEVEQNGLEEGGGNMAYTGWSAAPVAALLFELDGISTQVRGSRRGSASAFL